MPPRWNGRCWPATVPRPGDAAKLRREPSFLDRALELREVAPEERTGVLGHQRRDGVAEAATWRIVLQRQANARARSDRLEGDRARVTHQRAVHPAPRDELSRLVVDHPCIPGHRPPPRPLHAPPPAP